MKAARFLGNKRIKLREYEIPKLKDGEILLKVKSSGLCGSELKPFQSSNLSEKPGGKRLVSDIPGHEMTGEVVDTGSAKNVKVGDRVGVYIYVGCGHCEYCKQGKQGFCDELKVWNGSHAEFIAVPGENCLALPDEISYDVGVLLSGDAVGVPYHISRRLRVSALDTVAVIGAGAVGLGVILVLKFLGTKVLAVDLNDYRLNLAKNLGADYVVNSGRVDVEERVRDLTRGKEVDIGIECVGKDATTNLGLNIVKKGGILVLVGETPQAIVKPTEQIIDKELTVMGSSYYCINEYDGILNLYHQGLPAEKLITHRFGLEDIEKAFLLFEQGQTGKVIINP